MCFIVKFEHFMHDFSLVMCNHLLLSIAIKPSIKISNPNKYITSKLNTHVKFKLNLW